MRNASTEYLSQLKSYLRAENNNKRNWNIYISVPYGLNFIRNTVYSENHQREPHLTILQLINTFRPRQDGRRFPDDTFERIFLKENVIILIKISLKFVPKGPINNIPALVQIMASNALLGL